MRYLEFKLTLADNGYVLEWTMPAALGWGNGMEIHENLNSVSTRMHELVAEKVRLQALKDNGATEEELRNAS
jgi:hypothetical protein